MGTLENIRKTSPFLLGVFAVVFIGFMVISDMDPSTLMQNSRAQGGQMVAEINGQGISYSEYETLVRQQVEQKRAEADNGSPAAEEAQVRKDQWNQLVNKTLLTQQSQEMGVYVSKGQLLDVLLGNPPDYMQRWFQDSTGKFNRALYNEVMTNPDGLYQSYTQQGMQDAQARKMVNDFKKQIIDVQNYLKESKMQEAVMSAVGLSATVVSPEYAREKYLAANSTADVNYIFFDANSVQPNNIEVSDQEIREYYNEIKETLKQEPVRQIKYVQFPLRPSADDTIRAGRRVDFISQALAEATSKEAKDSVFDVKMSEYNGESKDFTLMNEMDDIILSRIADKEVLDIEGPIFKHDGVYFVRLDDKRDGENEVVKARHILIRSNDNSDSAKKVIDELYRKAKAGKDFAALAKEHSDDKGSAVRGGDLGYFGRNKMVKEFEKAAFETEPGQICKPVETNYGWHIIKVEDKKSEEMKYSQIVIKPLISQATRKSILRDAYALEKAVVEEGKIFDSVATNMKLTVSQSPFFKKNQPVIGSQYLTDMAFKLEIGDVIEPFTTKDDKIIIAQVADYRGEGFQSFEEVKTKLRNDLVGRKQLDKIKENAEKTYSQIKNSTHLTDAATTVPGLEVKTATGVKMNENIPGGGKDVAFTTHAFMLPLNKMSEPLRCATGYYIMEVVARQQPDDKTIAEALPAYIMNLQKNEQMNAFYKWFGKLKEESDIIDNRSNFYKEY